MGTWIVGLLQKILPMAKELGSLAEPTGYLAVLTLLVVIAMTVKEVAAIGLHGAALRNNVSGAAEVLLPGRREELRRLHGDTPCREQFLHAVRVQHQGPRERAAPRAGGPEHLEHRWDPSAARLAVGAHRAVLGDVCLGASAVELQVGRAAEMASASIDVLGLEDCRVVDSFGGRLALARCHASQLELREGKVLEHLRDLRRAWGGLAGVEYAEAFHSDDPVPLDLRSFV